MSHPVGRSDNECQHSRPPRDRDPVDGRTARRRNLGNCGALQANILLLPDAAVDDGELDIVLQRPEGVVSWAQIVTKIIWENGVLSRTRLGRRLRTKEVRARNYIKGRRFTMLVPAED